MDKSSFSFDDELTFSPSKKNILSEGNYQFTVVSVEPGYYEGGKVIPACKMIHLVLEIEQNGNKTRINDKLYLHESAKWKVKTLLLSLGLIDNSTTSCKVNWASVIGLKGYAKIAPHTFVGRNDHEITVNRVTSFLPKPAIELIELPEDIEQDTIPF